MKLKKGINNIAAGKSSFLVILLLLLLSATSHAQYDRIENAHWAFGKMIGLKFDTIANSIPEFFNSRIYENGNARVSYYEAAATVSDSAGNLLFYSNGSRIWNRNHKIMPNSVNGLHNYGPEDEMTTSTSNGAVIVPFPFTPNKYYLFSLTGIAPGMLDNAGALYYSVVDMTLDSGRGDIVDSQKWVYMTDRLSEKMVPIKGSCGNIWLVTHARDTNLFLSYEITKKGISRNPVKSYTGHNGYFGYILPSGAKRNFYYSIGDMKASPDFRRIGMVNDVTGHFAAVYDFDPATGKVSNELLLDNASVELYGCEFSPDSRKFYYTIYSDTTFGARGGIYQYDLTSSNLQTIKYSRKRIYTGFRPQIRLSPNGRISTYLGNIVNPNSTNAMWNDYPINLKMDLLVDDSARGFFGFGQPIIFAEYPIDSQITVQSVTVSCLDTNASLTASVTGEEYIWSDGSTSKDRKITDTGTFWVMSLRDCKWHVDTFKVFLNDDFDFGFKLPDDTVLCNLDAWEIQGPEQKDGITYLWQDGKMDQVYFAYKTGIYHLHARKGFCSVKDTIDIEFIRAHPNLGDDILICLEDKIDTIVTVRAETGSNATILWNTGSTAKSIQVTEPGTYSVTVSDRGCSGSDTIEVSKVLCDCELDYPNAFTPNGDGLNDYFLPFDISCPMDEYRLSVYDRFGKRVFTTENAHQGWDGTDNGTPLKVGVYFFYAKYKPDGVKSKVKHAKGDVTLIR